jgi:SP family general alpha glucoside:H+ symporter-like MFS transporter
MASEIHIEKSAAAHLEETLGSGAISEARQASDEEHSDSLWQALSANRKAVFWSMLISLSIVMEGYDIVLIGNFFAYPQFTHKYGQDYGGTTGWQISAAWQSALNMSSTVGAIIGLSYLSNFFLVYVCLC